MKALRKALGKRARFEVLKRDSFTCQYCGAKAPDALLDVDHINPVSKGGDNNITNLITACKACNSGKSNVKLKDGAAVRVAHKQLTELQERRQQIEMMAEWQKEMANMEPEMKLVIELIQDSFSVEINEYGAKLVRKSLRKYGFNIVFQAALIAVDQYEEGDAAINKLAGIAHNLHTKETNPALHWAGKMTFSLSYRFYESRDLTVFKSLLVQHLAALTEGADIEGEARRICSIIRGRCNSFRDAAILMNEEYL
jgi:hypothetical protein